MTLFLIISQDIKCSEKQLDVEQQLLLSTMQVCTTQLKNAQVTVPVINTSATRTPSPDPDSPDETEDIIGKITGDFDFDKKLQDFEDTTKALSVEDNPHEPLFNPAADVRLSISHIDGELAKIVSQTKDGMMPTTRESTGIEAGCSSKSVPLLELEDNSCVVTMAAVVNQILDILEPEPDLITTTTPTTTTIPTTTTSPTTTTTTGHSLYSGDKP